MNFQDYITRKKELYRLIKDYIDLEENAELNFENLINYIQENINLDDRKELYEILRLLSNIANYHHRHPLFFDKIIQILKYLSNDIKRTFSSLYIYNIFKKNAVILLFLLKNEIIFLDQYIISYFLSKSLTHYFSPEIQSYLGNDQFEKIPNTDDKLKRLKDDILKEIPEDFEEKRKSGENDSYLCQLIRNDSIDEFIIYINKTLLPLSSQIEPSIYETNNFLMNKKTTLIEYAAFFGSIKIFKYLLLNNVELTPNIIEYAIYSNNAELIYILEEDNDKQKKPNFFTCIKKAIKCHHNNVAEYFRDNYCDSDELENNLYEFGIHYYNYDFFPCSFNISILSSLISYDHIKIVEFLYNMKEFDLNTKIIFFVMILIMIFIS